MSRIACKIIFTRYTGLNHYAKKTLTPQDAPCIIFVEFVSCSRYVLSPIGWGRGDGSTARDKRARLAWRRADEKKNVQSSPCSLWYPRDRFPGNLFIVHPLLPSAVTEISWLCTNTELVRASATRKTRFAWNGIPWCTPVVLDLRPARSSCGPWKLIESFWKTATFQKTNTIKQICNKPRLRRQRSA